MIKSAKREYPSIMLVLVVGIITILCLAPFATKAFHIDDTLFLWTAKHIYTNPLDFYGSTANWYGGEMPISSINKNPPLVAYYIALVALFFGWNEVAIHLAFLIPALCLSLGTYYLARQLCSRPYLAALIALLTPVFLVSSTNIMSDTMMLAFYVWALALWVRGLEKDNRTDLFLSAIFVAFSALTKYFGMTLVPLLLIYSLVVKRGVGRWLFFLSIPVLILIGYQWLTYTLYGRGLLLDAASYAIIRRPESGFQFLTKFLTGLSFTGGCLAAVAFYFPFLWSRRYWFAGGLLLALLIAMLISMGEVGKLCLRNADGIRWGLVIQLALFVGAGINVLALAASDLGKQRDASSLLLFLWIFGTFLFASFINWTVNARTIFPMAPAIGIIVMRRLDQNVGPGQSFSIRNGVWPLIPAALIALSVTWADASLANCQRSAARMIHAEFNDYPRTLWFQGHWGFQYYMESLGGKALDFNNSLLQKGDIIVVPVNNTNIRPLRREICVFAGKRQLMPCRWLGTMQTRLGAGFYADVWGPLPFAVGAVPPEEYLFFLVGGWNNPPEITRYFR